MAFRIRELRQQLGKTNKEIAEDLGVPLSTVNSWTSGSRKPGSARIELIEEKYGLNPGWLAGEAVTMYPSGEEVKKRKQVREILNCQSPFAIDTMCRLAEASESEWKTLEKILKD